jgi:hypothetical protein
VTGQALPLTWSLECWQAIQTFGVEASTDSNWHIHCLIILTALKSALI